MIKLTDLQENGRKGLWANIHAKRKRGEKPARKGSKAYKHAVKMGKKIKAAEKNEEFVEDASRSRQEVSNEYSIANIGADATENGALKV